MIIFFWKESILPKEIFTRLGNVFGDKPSNYLRLICGLKSLKMEYKTRTPYQDLESHFTVLPSFDWVIEIVCWQWKTSDYRCCTRNRNHKLERSPQHEVVCSLVGSTLDYFWVKEHLSWYLTNCVESFSFGIVLWLKGYI